MSSLCFFSLFFCLSFPTSVLILLSRQCPLKNGKTKMYASFADSPLDVTLCLLEKRIIGFEGSYCSPRLLNAEDDDSSPSKCR